MLFFMANMLEARDVRGDENGGWVVEGVTTGGGVMTAIELMGRG